MPLRACGAAMPASDVGMSKDMIAAVECLSKHAPHEAALLVGIPASITVAFDNWKGSTHSGVVAAPDRAQAKDPDHVRDFASRQFDFRALTAPARYSSLCDSEYCRPTHQTPANTRSAGWATRRGVGIIQDLAQVLRWRHVQTVRTAAGQRLWLVFSVRGNVGMNVLYLKAAVLGATQGGGVPCNMDARGGGSAKAHGSEPVYHGQFTCCC